MIMKMAAVIVVGGIAIFNIYHGTIEGNKFMLFGGIFVFFQVIVVALIWSKRS